MRDIELYRAILGLPAPWTVTSVDLDVKGQQVVVQVEAGPGPFPCPECGTTWPRYDGRPRRWRHLDTCQFTTWIEAHVPRVECSTHGVRQIRVPWAEPGSQFTALFERLAIDLLRECSVTGAAGLLGITWDEAWGIKGRAVKHGLWEPYVQSTRAALQEADTKSYSTSSTWSNTLHEAVDQVRRAEHRALQRAGDDRLTGFKYLWLMRPQAMSPAQREAFQALQGQDLKVARAWALKERFRTFWEYRYFHC